MTTFPALEASASGARAADLWLDVIANNIANINTIRPANQVPFRADHLTVAPAAGGGVQVTGVQADQAAPTRSYEPGNPLADANGYVTHPVVDMANEMSSLIIAQRLYSANLNVHAQVRDAYRAALQIGK